MGFYIRNHHLRVPHSWKPPCVQCDFPISPHLATAAKERSMTRLQGQLEAAMVKASREAQAKNVGVPRALGKDLGKISQPQPTTETHR